VRKNTRCNGYGQEEAKKRFSGSLYSVKAHTHMMPARKLCLVTTRQRERERERERETNKQRKALIPARASFLSIGNCQSGYY
jgi:hypothetical protein